MGDTPDGTGAWDRRNDLQMGTITIPAIFVKQSKFLDTLDSKVTLHVKGGNSRH